ncbi:MAG: GIY-YIG nuclease family protein [Flavobacteriales bacterium]|nr:GIY-YIG nuclease family protein [Flavobacteriales bacterium]
MKQYVYIFSNEEHEKIKIGRTNKHPEVRAEQLNRQTGVIGKFICEWFKEVKDSEYIENSLHYFLRDFHYEKEYYILEPIFAQELANKIINDIEAIDMAVPSIIKDRKSSTEARIKILKKMLDKETLPKKKDLIRNRLKLLENLLNYSL